LRIPNRPPVVLVDLSVGGALLDLPFQLRPDSPVTVELMSGSELLTVPFRPLRVYVGSLDQGIRYKAAGAFVRDLHLKDVPADRPADSATARLASALDALLRNGNIAGQSGRVPQFDHLLGWILDAVRRGERPEVISMEIRDRLSRLIPALAVTAASTMFLADPARSARFFGFDFIAPRLLTGTERRVLRAAAQLLDIVEGRSSGESDRPPALHREPNSVSVVRSIAEWQQGDQEKSFQEDFPDLLLSYSPI
jgi:hypothetical protein